MKQVRKLKLSQLSKNELEKKELKKLKGGGCCICGGGGGSAKRKSFRRSLFSGWWIWMGLLTFSEVR